MHIPLLWLSLIVFLINFVLFTSYNNIISSVCQMNIILCDNNCPSQWYLINNYCKGSTISLINTQSIIVLTCSIKFLMLICLITDRYPLISAHFIIVLTGDTIDTLE